MTDTVKRGDTPPQALQKLLMTYEKQIVAALPTHMQGRPDKIIRLAVTALHQSPSLQNCSMLSLANSVMLAAQLGLEFNTSLGHGWLIPYGKVCTFQIGYRGLIELAYRTGTIKDATAKVVYSNELKEFEYEEGAIEKLRHKPLPPSERGQPVGIYTRLKLYDDTTSFHFMWMEEIHEIRDKTSKPYRRWANATEEERQKMEPPAWVVWAEAMEKKTVFKQHLKTRRLSPEVLRAVGIDDEAEAFGARDEKSVKGKPEVAQDLVLEAEFQDDAVMATDELVGSAQIQEQVAQEKIAALSDPPISKNKQTRIINAASEAGYPDDASMYRFLMKNFGISDIATIKESQYQTIMLAVQAGGLPPEPGKETLANT